MMAGRIDLTVGFGIVMWHILAISLQVKYGVPWPLAILIVIACAGFDRPRQRPAGRSGAGRLLRRDARHRHDPLCARALAHRRTPDCRHRCRPASSPSTRLDLRNPDPGALCPDRSRSYCGSSASACRSAASSMPSAPTRRRPRSTAFRCAPMSSACSSPRASSPASPAACSAQSCASARRTSGLIICCRRWSAPFSARRRSSRGRVNIWGTIFGVLILAVGISGIQQLGGAFFVEPLFNGTTLVISIALAAFAQRQRSVVRPTRALNRGAKEIPKGSASNDESPFGCTAHRASRKRQSNQPDGP